ncbi:UNVERIFIED_CONTAM: hypothetical protein Sradi_7023400, partial [Sesamum radiatum]
MCSLCERATVECAEDGRVKEANVMLPLCKASSGGGWVPMVTSKFGLQYKDIKVGGRRSPPVGFQWFLQAKYLTVVSRLCAKQKQGQKLYFPNLQQRRFISYDRRKC